MRFINFPNAKYRPYMGQDGKVVVKTTYWFNDEFLERERLFYNKTQTAFIEFDTKLEAEQWIIDNLKEENIGPLELIQKTNDKLKVIYRPYLSNQGFVTIVSISEDHFEPYDFERFFPNEKVEGSYIEFDCEKKAHDWILKCVENQYVDPQLRALNLNDYLKPKYQYPTNETTPNITKKDDKTTLE